jgi:hypothetical protein
MPLWLLASILFAYLAAPIVELRLWRAGRLSDRAVTGLLVARMPVLLLVVFPLWFGRAPDVLLVAAIVAIAVLGYRLLLPVVRERGRELRSRGA